MNTLGHVAAYQHKPRGSYSCDGPNLPTTTHRLDEWRIKFLIAGKLQANRNLNFRWL
jgi:hypothetical protein